MENGKCAANQDQLAADAGEERDTQGSTSALPDTANGIGREIALFALENNMPLHVAVAIFRLEAKRHFREGAS